MGALWTNAAVAADLQTPILKTPPSIAYFDPSLYEIRFGALAHGVGGPEANTVDLNVEFVFPRLPFGLGEWWNLAIPRPHLGGLGNVSGLTSSAYVGALWTVPLAPRIFAEAFLDGAVHDGELQGDAPNHSELGCRELFHVGGSVGYVFAPRWSVMLSFDHLSNGKSLFATPCLSNEGINDYGLRFGYSF